MSGDQESGKALRSVRRAAGKTLAELASEIGIDTSYLSRVETGERPVTEEIHLAYSRLANLPLPAEHQEDSLVNEIIKEMRQLTPHTTAALEKLAQERARFEQATTSRHSEIDKFWTKFLNKRLTKDCQVVLVLADWHDYLWKSEGKKWPAILSRILLTGASLKIFFATSHNSVDQIEQTKWILFQQLNCILLGNKVTFDTVSNLQTRQFAMDFFLVKNQSVDIRFSSKRPGVKNVMSVSGEIAAVEEYLEKIELYRDNKVHVFFGKEDVSRFLDEYLATENVSGPRNLSQTFLGSHTRPPEHFSEGTNWWRRYQKKEKRGFPVERLAESRKRAAIFLRQRMDQSPVRQICSKEVLTEWALKGTLPGFPPAQIYDGPEDRINQIQYICELLEQNTRFEIAVIDQKDGAPLGWSEDNSTPNINWLVQGTERLVLESHIVNSDGTQKEYQCIVNDRAIILEFSRKYETFWNRLPRAAKDPRQTIQFFEELRDDIRSSISDA
jgi:transcriptional regulator with XRE-family HTH domain